MKSVRTLNNTFSLLLLLGLLGAFTGGLHLFFDPGVALVSGVVWKAALGLGAVLLIVATVSRYFPVFVTALPVIRLRLHPLPVALFFLLFMISDFPGRGFALFVDPGGRSEVLLLGLSVVVGLALYQYANTGKGDVLRLLPQRFERIFSVGLLLFLQLVIFVAWERETNGQMLFSDDHPSFLYRLQLLRSEFPNIPFYNTQWNSGYQAREFFPSGVLNVYLLALPFVYLFGDLQGADAARLYNFIIVYLYAFVVPWSVYLAARVLSLGHRAGIIAGILALAPTLGVFEWMLKYGTLGFSMSAGLIPLALALAYRTFIADERPQWWHVFALTAVSSLVIMWSLSFVVFLPLVVLALFRLRVIFSRRRARYFFSFVLLFTACNVSWMTTFVQESKVFSFLSQSTLPGSNSKTFDRQHLKREISAADEKTGIAKGLDNAQTAHRRLKEQLVKYNPLLLLLLLPGLASLRSRRLRYLGWGLSFWLLFLAAWGDFIKPQLELRRMVIPLAYFLCLPVAVWLVGAFRWMRFSAQAGRTFRVLLAAVLLLGGIFIGPMMGAAIWANRSDERYVTATSEVDNLAAAIKQYGGAGRTFFLGFILHDLSSRGYDTQDGGHVAPLPFLAEKPMFASDFYHRSWSALDPIPVEYRKRGVEGIEEFLDLHNTTAVVTFLREWKDYVHSQANYREVFHQGRFRLFVRESKNPGYIMKGRAEVKDNLDSIVVTPQTIEVVLKFRHLPNLQVYPAGLAEILPLKAYDRDLGGGRSEEFDLIQLRLFTPEALGRELTISY
ncbi:MAG: hypothetical protein PHC51_03870 [bacterium]|nr:hypothetical protein [bacterium]